MPKSKRSPATGISRKPVKKIKNEMRLQLDCQLFTRTICPDFPETVGHRKDC